VILKETGEYRDRENLIRKSTNKFPNQGQLPSWINSICIWFTKTRSGKIMRRILRKIAEGDYSGTENST
jgi:acetyl-CoA synthetase